MEELLGVWQALGKVGDLYTRYIITTLGTGNLLALAAHYRRGCSMNYTIILQGLTVRDVYPSGINVISLH